MVIQKLNDTPNSPLRFITDDGTTFGQFYNSWDKLNHLAEYVPYETLPSKRLCGKVGQNFSPSRSEGENRTRLICPECHKKFMELSNNMDIWK
jgi:hypothetical protein